MIDFQATREIIATYCKYGWVLRRVLVNGPEDSQLADSLKGFVDVRISRSDLNAAWFSRPPAAGPIAWEIRYLGGIQFALLENLDERDPDFERSLSEIEAPLGEAIRVKKAP